MCLSSLLTTRGRSTGVARCGRRVTASSLEAIGSTSYNQVPLYKLNTSLTESESRTRGRGNVFKKVSEMSFFYFIDNLYLNACLLQRAEIGSVC